MTNRTWQEGAGDRTLEHFEIWYGREDQKVLVARVWASKFGSQTVELFPNDSMGRPERDRLQERLFVELDRYLMKPDEPDIRKYLRHHCNTAANVYGMFSWTLVEPTVSKR